MINISDINKGIVLYPCDVFHNSCLPGSKQLLLQWPSISQSFITDLTSDLLDGMSHMVNINNDVWVAICYIQHDTTNDTYCNRQDIYDSLNSIFWHSNVFELDLYVPNIQQSNWIKHVSPIITQLQEKNDKQVITFNTK